MRFPFLITLAISVSACAFALFVQAAGNRSLEQQLANHRGLVQQRSNEQVEAETALSNTLDRQSQESAEERFERALTSVEQLIAAEEQELVDLLEAVRGLDATELIEIARRISNSENAASTKERLLLIAARPDTAAVLENEELFGPLTKNSVLAAYGLSDPLAALGLLPPIAPMDPSDAGSSGYQTEDIKLRTHLAILAMGVDAEAGLRAFLEVRRNDPSKRGVMEPITAFAGSGRTPLAERSIPGLVAAIADPEFQPIRDDLIKMTLDHYLQTRGLAAAAAQAESMPLSTNDVRHYVDSLKSYNIMKLEPIPTMEWVATALPTAEQLKMVPALFLDWVKQEATSASSWLKEQSPSPVRDQTIASFATTAPSLDNESAALWALEIQDEISRTNTLHTVLEKWRQEDPSAAALWAENNAVKR